MKNADEIRRAANALARERQSAQMFRACRELAEDPTVPHGLRKAAQKYVFAHRLDRIAEVAWEALAFTLVAVLVAFCLWAVYLAVGAEVPRS